MKLFDDNAKNAFVYAVVGKNAKEGTPPTYQAIHGGSFEECEGKIEQRAQRNAYPHVVGRYDDLGRYCTYQPPIEGVRPGKFILHPLADAEYKASRAY